jgi:hypothetical protein
VLPTSVRVLPSETEFHVYHRLDHTVCRVSDKRRNAVLTTCQWRLQP